MTPTTVVTVIIIVYDGEAFLDEAIDSVAAQTFTAWELLVVDDGSTDTGPEIARRHAATDPRIRTIAHPDGGNHGMSATRNLGLSHARSTYVGFLDADDVWEPTKLEEQVAILDDHPEAAMVYGRTLIWHQWADPPAAVADFYFDLGVEPDRVHDPPVLFRNLLGNVYQTPTTCNALVRRAVIEEVGGFEAPFRGLFEDQVFFAKVHLHHPVYVSDRSWARYRQHPSSSSARSGVRTDLAAHVGYLRWLRRHVCQQGGHLGDCVAVERALWSVRGAGMRTWAKGWLPWRRRR